MADELNRFFNLLRGSYTYFVVVSADVGLIQRSVEDDPIIVDINFGAPC